MGVRRCGCSLGPKKPTWVAPPLVDLYKLKDEARGSSCQCSGKTQDSGMGRHRRAPGCRNGENQSTLWECVGVLYCDREAVRPVAEVGRPRLLSTGFAAVADVSSVTLKGLLSMFSGV